MFIKASENKVKYISFAYYASSDITNQLYLKTKSLSDFVKVYNIGHPPTDIQSIYSGYIHGINVNNTTGIYFGELKDIKLEIYKKLTKDLSAVNKIYFDPCCKYPKFKLNNLKSCIDYTKADVTIIKKNLFYSYESSIVLSKFVNNDDMNVLILYSNKNDCYYLIDYYPTHINDKNKNIEFQAMFPIKPLKTSKEMLNYWAQALIDCGTLPIDCQEYYYGPIILTGNKDEAEFLNNLPSYKHLVYEHDLDNFISDSLPKLTNKILNSIENMLCSTDLSIIELGLKSLYSYDIRTHICRLGMILIKYKDIIKNTKAYSSSAFTVILNRLNLTKANLNYCSTEQLYNTLYVISHNLEDRECLKDVVKKQIIKVITTDYNFRFYHSLKNLDLKFNVTVE